VILDTFNLNSPGKDEKHLTSTDGVPGGNFIKTDITTTAFNLYFPGNKC